MINVAILGASGYGGGEVLRILSANKNVKINYLGANSQVGSEISSTFANFYGLNDMKMLDSTIDSIMKIATNNDCIIAATPHEFLAHILNEKILQHCVVVDLSADFRLKNPAKYKQYYNFTHKNLDILKQAVYGLCEFNADCIKNAQIIANPGCYPTASTFAIAPFLPFIEPKSIIIDAKSGVSGAGRGAKVENLFCEINENIRAYGLINHRHIAEIEQNLSAFSGHDFTLDSKHFDALKESVNVTFSPHLVPMSRGILVTSYASLKPDFQGITQDELDSILSEFYADKYFVRVLKSGVPPQTRWVRGSNFSDVSVRLDARNNRLIMMSALDNLIKGAAGAAVQNFNIRFGFSERESLESIALFP